MRKWYDEDGNEIPAPKYKVQAVRGEDDCIYLYDPAYWFMFTAEEAGLDEQKLRWDRDWIKTNPVKDRWTCSQCGASLIQENWAVAECSVCGHRNGFVDFQTTVSC